MAKYIMGRIDFLIHGLGFLLVASFLSAIFILEANYHQPFFPLEANESPRQREEIKKLSWQFIFGLASIFVLSLLILIFHKAISIVTLIAIVLLVAIGTSLIDHPISLSRKGWGEILKSICISTIVPVFAFTLQYHDMHRLLLAVSFPLLLLVTSYLIIGNYDSFTKDFKNGKETLLIKIGILNAAKLHHLLILCAYLIFASLPIIQIPWRLIWPVFLTIPFSLLQIIWLQDLVNGGKIKAKSIFTLAGTSVSLAAILISSTFFLG